MKTEMAVQIFIKFCENQFCGSQLITCITDEQNYRNRHWTGIPKVEHKIKMAVVRKRVKKYQMKQPGMSHQQKTMHDIQGGLNMTGTICV
jgi:hypothetical protein